MSATRACSLILTAGLLLFPGPGEGAENPDLDRVEDLIVRMTNDFRQQEGRPRLKINPELTRTAQYFVDYLARTDQFSHTADGQNPSDRARKHGYAYCIIAENIAYEYNSAGFETTQLARQLVTGWENSPEHRRNMLDPDVTEIGVAVAQSRESGRYYGVQEFGRPRSKTISFQILNRTGQTLRYALDDHPYTVEAGYTMTHEDCRPPAVQFQSRTASAGTIYHVHAGEKLVVTRGPAGELRVEQK